MPIDGEFQKKLQPTGEHQGHKVWGETNPPTKLGIHGTTVAVDHDLCNGDEICASVCPVNVFDIIDTPDNPVSKKKSDPTREKDCIQCLACETQCPTQAIKVTPP
ncbi:MAG: 4Fe-4S binding protein [archaeon]